MLVPQASADFKSSDYDFKKIEINKELTATYEYVNINSSPAILLIGETKTEAGKCWVSDYTKNPILPAKSGNVTLKCNFKQLGYHSQGIDVTVIEKSGRRQKRLTYRATAFTKVIKVAPKPKPPVVTKPVVKPAPKKPYPKYPDMDLNITSPLKNIPIGDQDGVGICYAFATSTIIEYELRSKNNKRTVSPIDAGFVLKSTSQTGSRNLDYGNPMLAVNEIRQHGVASKECIDKVMKKETANTKMTSENFLNFMQEIYILKADKKSEEEIEKEMDKLCKQYGVTSDEFENYMKDFEVPLRTYLRTIFAECEKERQEIKSSDLPQYLYYAPVPHDEMKAKIDYFLNKNKPAAISMCAQILQGKIDHKGLDEKRAIKKDANNKSLCAGHAVIIAGRKEIKGETNYLIRNSWGASYQSKGLTCACKTSTDYYSDCSLAPKNASNKVITGCWVPENKLIPNMMSVGGFK